MLLTADLNYAAYLASLYNTYCLKAECFIKGCIKWMNNEIMGQLRVEMIGPIKDEIGI